MPGPPPPPPLFFAALRKMFIAKGLRARGSGDSAKILSRKDLQLKSYGIRT